MTESRTIGLNFEPNGTATLKVWAPMAKTVKMAVEQGPMLKLMQAPMGFWELHNIAIDPGTHYKIVLDGKAFPDPASLSQPEGVHGPSCAINLGKFSWTDSNWKGIKTEDLIIYELHTGTFSSEGTFDGIINKLDYLVELGITAIELMPVSQFPGTRNWGYDGVYPFAVQHTYGGAENLQTLVNKSHQKGLAVILDVVYNHLGPEGNYLPAFGPVFTEKYTTPWGKAINFDDAWCDGIRNFFIENALMWLRDFHIDGLRLDAVHAVKDFGALHLLKEMKEKVEELNLTLSRNHFLICESDLNDTKFITPVVQGGYGLDATWCDEFHHSLHALATGEKKGYYEDFGGIKHLVKSLNHAFVYDGNWSEHRKRKFGNKTTGLNGNKFVVFVQNHDQVGNRMLGDRLATLINFELLKTVAGTMLLSPFIPLLFMGEEYAETRPFLYFTNHGDADLTTAVREGRKKEFMSFMELGEPPDPDAPETFSKSKLKTDTQDARQKQIFNYYKKIIQLRKTIPALKNMESGSYSATAVDNKKALILKRTKSEEILLVAVNFESDTIKFKPGNIGKTAWQLVLNSSGSIWGGPDGAALINGSEISVPGQSVSVWINT